MGAYYPPGWSEDALRQLAERPFPEEDDFLLVAEKDGITQREGESRRDFKMRVYDESSVELEKVFARMREAG